MLIPAILKKEEIQNGFRKYYYTDDMMYETGYMGSNWIPEIPNMPNDSDWCNYQYASVDNKDNVIGYFGYRIDWYSSIAYNFGMMSFDRGNIIFGKDVHTELLKLINEYKLHKIEWRMVSGNPAERGYDRFCKKFNGNKHIIKDVFKDKQGNYRHNIIYEIFNKED